MWRNTGAVPAIQEAEIGWPWVQSQPGQCRKTLPEEDKQTNNNKMTIIIWRGKRVVKLWVQSGLFGEHWLTKMYESFPKREPLKRRDNMSSLGCMWEENWKLMPNVVELASNRDGSQTQSPLTIDLLLEDVFEKRIFIREGGIKAGHFGDRCDYGWKDGWGYKPLGGRTMWFV